MEREKNKTVSYGFVGRWNDGTLGWCLPAHAATTSRRFIEPPSGLFNEHGQPNDRAVLCKITVEVIHDSLGREIRRKPKKN